MGKKNKQHRKPLPTTPISTPNVAGISSNPVVLFRPALQAPVTPVLPRTEEVASTTSLGVVVSIIYQPGGTTPIFGKIATPTGLLTIHSKESQIPKIGTRVLYETYTFQNYKGKEVQAARVLEVTGSNPEASKRLQYLESLDVYIAVPPEEYIMGNGAIDNPAIIGTLDNGNILFHYKSSRAGL